MCYDVPANVSNYLFHVILQKFVVAVLERYYSVDDEEDIVASVAQLGKKLDAAKALVSRRDAAKSEKVSELEEALARQHTEVEELRAHKLALEKRLEQLKSTAKAGREASAAMTVEVEALTAKVEELKAQLKKAETRVASSSDVSMVSSAVQALEDENMDLLKENKELRLEVSRFRSSSSCATDAGTATTSGAVCGVGVGYGSYGSWGSTSLGITAAAENFVYINLLLLRLQLPPPLLLRLEPSLVRSAHLVRMSATPPPPPLLRLPLLRRPPAFSLPVLMLPPRTLPVVQVTGKTTAAAVRHAVFA